MLSTFQKHLRCRKKKCAQDRKIDKQKQREVTGGKKQRSAKEKPKQNKKLYFSEKEEKQKEKTHMFP